MAIILAAIFASLVIGIGLGIKIAEAVAARWVRDGKMFYYHEKRHTWVGDKDAIIRQIRKHE